MQRRFVAALTRCVLLFALATSAAAQLASEIEVQHRDGQTFVTWRESTLTGVRYRVYRSFQRIRGESDLAQAELLGEVDDRSSQNMERTRVEGAVRTWVIRSGSAPLSSSRGLFVHTVAEGSAAAYYAVTSVRAQVETRTITRGRNATEQALAEWSAPPQAVLQSSQNGRESWGHWVGNRDTPHQAAMSLWPSQGFAFGYEAGSASGRRGLLLRLHPAGGSYAQGWPTRAMVPADVDVLAPSDLHPVTSFSFWFGAHERFPLAPLDATRVWAYTQQRLLWTLDWMLERRGGALERARVSLAGSSLGATGGMLLLEEAPERFAAALLRSGNYDLRAGDFQDDPVFERLWGDFALDLPVRSGPGILERTDARFMARLDPAADWPLIRTLDGRGDQRVGWRSAVGLYAALAETWRPAVSYFDERAHGAIGYWSPLERKLVERTCQVRSDRPSLRFTNCTLDADAGDGTRTSGDAIGALNGAVEYDPLTATATPDAVRFDVFLRAQGALDDAQATSALVELTPRRAVPFALAAGELVRFTLREGATLVREHWLSADPYGLVHTPPVPLSRARREARFERASAQAVLAAPGLELDDGPRGGAVPRATLSGLPGQRWQLLILAGLRNDADAARSTMSGVLDASGRAVVPLEAAGVLPAGARIRARARIGVVWTPWRVAVVAPR